ncbi:putative protein serine/threonine kinase [Cavenderia fasciculata]|uniref:Serine/threonine-protein kinase RIO2 n=1 Tax=Cavenderia fasciculata TaxID=261658 RepID=F4QBT6_CACFS|nr:putative protein serine/threonine kinase [Cavenderia fasciculata]EGG14674.1 putative protein serine/threonine kinase [Cavenderia fasciculata]|eukprot:XP_004351182.1 putative protein serine/threonine kinase [Cavenderia fasciculata]
MKLEAKAIRYLTRDDWRTLVATEMGMKNHEFVPTNMICTIANLKFGGGKKAIRNIHKFKLLYHENKKYDGYKLTYLGYDYLALKAFVSRDTVSFVGTQIGVGKESDIYLVANDNNEEMVLKLHRLGRVSFKTIKNNRDYLKHRKNASWLYLSRLAALKEFAYMKALYENGFPVPTPIDVNRHCIVMSRVKGYPLLQVVELRHPSKVYADLMNLIVKLANYGLIHGDFNEFNILINDEEQVTLIDFPQMVSTSHANAEYYFDRDVNCIRTFFEKRYGFIGEKYPKFSDYKQAQFDLDKVIGASGFTKDLQKDMDLLIKDQDGDEELNNNNNSDSDDNSDDDDDDDEDNEEENQDEQSSTTEENNSNPFQQDEEESEEEEEEEESEEESESESESEEEEDIEVKQVRKTIKGLPTQKNRKFKFSDLAEEESPVLLRKEFLEEMKVLDGEVPIATTDAPVEGEEETEEMKLAREEERKQYEKRMIQSKVKRALDRQTKGKSNGRNAMKSRAKKEIKKQIASGF